MARKWKPWTEIKLDALSDYLGAFTGASATASRTLYLDLFAGAATNLAADGTGREVISSPVRALSANPPFTQTVFCELGSRNATQLRQRLMAEFPGRQIDVLPGDCNQTIPHWLAAMKAHGWDWAPTIAFIDQYAAEIRWSTIEYLSRWRRRNKVELLMYFGDSFIIRGVHRTDGEIMWRDFAARVDAMFGVDSWQGFLRGRDEGLLTGAELRAELVNLMRYRLERVLGYSTTLPVQLTDGRGNPLYTLIFATTHDVGAKIIRHIFTGVSASLEQYQRIAKARSRDAREAEKGLPGLLSIESVVQGQIAEHVSPTFEPPREPWQYPGSLG